MQKSAMALLCFLLLVPAVSAVPNPAAVYCEKLGFTYEKVQTANGERAVCMFPDGQCDAWKFYNGECGNEHAMSFALDLPQDLEFSGEVRFGGTIDSSAAQRYGTAFGDGGNGTGNTTEPDVTEFDWRDVNGSNWVTPIRDQGTCGSCWAFATVAIAESKFMINLNNSLLLPDLSEQQLVSCSPAGSCAEGGLLDDALDFMVSDGIVDETCFHYSAADITCTLCSDWKTSLRSVQNWSVLTPQNAMWYLENEEPITFGFEIYTNFMNYNGGIYQGFGGSFEGLHAMALIGYNHTGGYWIVKNSWGTGWGEGGYARISYGVPLYTTYGGSDASMSVLETDWDYDGAEDRIDGCPYTYNPSQEDLDNNSVQDACDCMPSWLSESYNCSIDDSYPVAYIDSNSCGKTYGLPEDNGTFSSCDYCQENITETYGNWSECVNGTKYRNVSYADLNFGNCCNVTDLTTDCSINNGSFSDFMEEENCSTIPEDLNDTGESNTSSDGESFRLFIGDEEYTNQTLNSTEYVRLVMENRTLVEFEFNFSEDELNVSGVNLSVEGENGTYGYVLVHGLVLEGNSTKTVYVDRLSESTGVCLIDDVVLSLNQFTDACSGDNETWVKCPGITGTYECSVVNETYSVTGLRHSGVKEQDHYCGDGSCNGGESCSSCSIDCDPCPKERTETKSNGGSSSGYISSYTPPACEEDWYCTLWSDCRDGMQVRTCIDQERCGTEDGKPTESQACDGQPPEDSGQALRASMVIEKTEPEAESVVPTGMTFREGVTASLLAAAVALAVAIVFVLRRRED